MPEALDRIADLARACRLPDPGRRRYQARQRPRGLRRRRPPPRRRHRDLRLRGSRRAATSGSTGCCDEPARAGDRACRARAWHDASEPGRRRRGRARRGGGRRGVARARGRGSRGGRRACRRRRAARPARTLYVSTRALLASRHHPAVHGCSSRRGNRAGRGRRTRPQSGGRRRRAPCAPPVSRSRSPTPSRPAARTRRGAPGSATGGRS